MFCTLPGWMAGAAELPLACAIVLCCGAVGLYGWRGIGAWEGGADGAATFWVPVDIAR